jgi:hypothetical protein
MISVLALNVMISLFQIALLRGGFLGWGRIKIKKFIYQILGLVQNINIL